MRQRLAWNDKIGMLFLAAGVVMLGIAVYLCRGSDIWYDELFTMGLADQSFGDLISITARDVHPPLYYLLVKLAMMMNEVTGSLFHPVTVAKLTSVFPFVLAMVLSVTEIRRQFGLFSAGLFLFLLVSMPQMPDYAVEIRMYGYAQLFVLAGMLCAYRIVKEPFASHVFAFPCLTICALAACYTHYFACVAACMSYVYLLVGLIRAKAIRKKRLPFLASGMVCAAGYLPWLLLVVTRQVKNVKDNYWIQPVSWRTLGGCVKFIFRPSFASERLNTVLAVLGFVIYAGLAAEILMKIIIHKERKSEYDFIIGGIGVLLGLILFGMLVSVVVRPIFVYRYMLPAMAVFWLAFAILADGMANRKYFLTMLILLIAIVGIRNFRAFYGEEMWKFKQMEEAEKAFLQISAQDVLLFNFGQTQAVVSYYLDNDTYLWYEQPEELIREMYPKTHSLVEGEFSDEQGIAGIRELLSTGKRVWFFGSGNAREEILAKWEENGIFSEEKDSVMVERYWFNIYAIRSGED